MSYEGLAGHFKNNFSLMHHHKWPLSDVEGMMPWERQIYIEMLAQYLKEQEQKMKDLENEQKAQLQAMLRKKM
jgi:hypothetical protein